LRYLLMKVPLVEKYLLTQESEKHSHQQRTTWQWTFAFPYTQALLAAQDFGVDVNVGDSAGMVLVLLSLPMSTRWLSTCLTNESRQVGTDTAPGMPWASWSSLSFKRKSNTVHCPISAIFTRLHFNHKTSPRASSDGEGWKNPVNQSRDELSIHTCTPRYTAPIISPFRMHPPIEETAKQHQTWAYSLRRYTKNWNWPMTHAYSIHFNVFSSHARKSRSSHLCSYKALVMSELQFWCCLT